MNFGSLDTKHYSTLRTCIAVRVESETTQDLALSIDAFHIYKPTSPEGWMIFTNSHPSVQSRSFHGNRQVYI